MIYRLLLAIVFAASLGSLGCTIPVSEHPLTDEKTSTLDERLIGYWRFIPQEKEEKPPPAPHIVSRVKDKPNCLQMTFIELDGEGYANVQTILLFTTKIGEECYLSYNAEQERDKKPGYLIARYELADDEGKLFLMNPDEAAAAIDGGKLKGVVKRQARRAGADPNEPVRYDEIRITAEPKEIAEFLKARGKACYVLDHPLVFRRVNAE